MSALYETHLSKALEEIERLQKLQARIWDEGYEAGRRDAERVASAEYHTSECDCETPTENPYEEDCV